MENRVITIARSYGSGGRKMGRLLAKELGYEYYDREILRIASDESGISEELFNQVDERQHLPLFRIAREAYTGEVIPPDSDDLSPTKICSAIRRRSSASWRPRATA